MSKIIDEIQGDALAAIQLGKDKVFQGLARFAYCSADKKGTFDDSDRFILGGTLVLPKGVIPFTSEYRIMDCEVYIVPIRAEEYTYLTNARIDQILVSNGFADAFREALKNGR